ncbi:MAG: hypothetical protein CVU77_04445 [Elusimicrobia bacterium HGW-Elusimicrobia-1]|jgi:hypothetical protein|nr:MAG: hypothetical protein CVU77_04445 [Elusimicrobia bacterium HGW-Elusimicrobia-1]
MPFKVLAHANTYNPPPGPVYGASYLANETIKNIAGRYDIRVVAHCGDCSAGADEYQMQHCAVTSLIRPLLAEGRHYLIINGKNALRSADSADVIQNDHFGLLRDNDLWKNLRYYPECASETLEFSDGQKLRIIALPYLSTWMFAAGRPIRSYLEMSAAASEHVQNKLAEALSADDPAVPLLVIYHGAVSVGGAQACSVGAIVPGYDVRIPIEMFPRRANVAVVAGHASRYGVLSRIKPMVVYAGFTVPTIFDTENTGVALLNFDGTSWSHEFMPVDTVESHTVEINIGDLNNRRRT